MTQMDLKAILRYMVHDPSIAYPFLRWYLCTQISNWRNIACLRRWVAILRPYVEKESTKNEKGLFVHEEARGGR